MSIEQVDGHAWDELPVEFKDWLADSEQHGMTAEDWEAATPEDKEKAYNLFVAITGYGQQEESTARLGRVLVEASETLGEKVHRKKKDKSVHKEWFGVGWFAG